MVLAVDGKQTARPMHPPVRQRIPRGEARERILDAALEVIRAQGYSATSVDQLCAAAGVTKGAFFHHFASKEDLAVQAAEHWNTTTGEMFRSAPYHQPDDPLDRVLAYIDFRRAIVVGDPARFTCLLGTMVQEAYGASEPIRESCGHGIAAHAETLEADIEAAMARYPPTRPVKARSLALYTQAVVQGGFVLAKALGDPEAARQSYDHLRHYIELLFDRSHRKEETS
jgi:TetR/AcrR family transcriptional regulator, transcriptional repressor for nem operon